MIDAEQCRSLLLNMLDGFADCQVVFDGGQPQDFIYLAVNPAFETVTGLKKVVGKKATEVIPGIKESNPELFDITGRVALTGQSERFETYIESLGIRFSISVYSTQIGRFQIIFENITERSKVEETLQMERERFRLATESLSDILYEWDLGSRVEWIGNIDEMLGFASGEFPRTLQAWMDILHPDDRERVWSAVELQLKGEAAYNIEYRVRHKNGAWLHWLARGAVLRDTNSNPYRWVGAITDTTEKNQVGEELLHSRERERFLADIIETSDQPVGVGYPDGRLGICNRAFCELTGYIAEELQGLDWSKVLTPSEWVEPETKALVELARTRKPVRYQKEYICKDGHRVPIELLVHATWDEAGNIKYYYAFVTDITERKKAEDALRHSETFLNSIIEHSPLAMWISDDKGTLIRLNQACRDLLHIRDDEVVGKYNVLQDNIVAEQGFLPLVRRVFENSESARFTIRYDSSQIKDLELATTASVVLDVTISPVLDANGRVTNAVIQHIDITDMKRTEDALRESELRFRSLFENSSIGLYRTTPGGQILLANPTLIHLLGFENFTELSQRNLEADGYGPDYPRSQFRQRMESENIVMGLESSWTRKDGITVFVRESAKVTRDSGGRTLYYEGTVEDITEWKRAEIELHESEERYRRLAGNALDIVYRFEIGPPYRVAYINPVVAAITGYTPQEFYTDPDLAGKLVCSDDLKNFVRIGSGDTGTNTLTSLRFIRKDGQIIWLEMRNIPVLDDTGKLIALEGIARDITERKQAEGEIHKLNAELEERIEERTRELRAAQEKLVRQERLAVLGQLAGGVGHELRNPLGVISNAVYFLRLIQPQADDQVKEYLGIIANETRTAEKIVNDLLDYSRIKFVDKEPIAISNVIQHVLERYPAPAVVTISLQIDPDLPLAYADSRQLFQILSNLVVNAYQAMPDGGNLIITAKKDVDEIAMSVEDTGVGIPAENIEKIFEPLFTTKMHGIGLGLAVCQKLIQANDGRIEVHSVPGKGSIFSVYTPISKDMESTATH